MRGRSARATIDGVVMDRGWVAEKFNRRAPSYDQSASHRWQARQAVDVFAPTRGERLLDIATGTGLAARAAVSRLGRDGAVVGSDVAAGMLRAARRTVDDQRCWFVQADAAASPFASGAFDGVLCVAGAPYFPDVVAALADWRRVARSAARAVVTVPAPGGITSARVLREAAATEGIELADPGGLLARPQTRARALAAAGWREDDVAEVVFQQPLSDPAEAFGWVESGFAEPLRTSAEPVRHRVWRRFETLYASQRVEEHRILLVRAATSSCFGSPTTASASVTR